MSNLFSRIYNSVSIKSTIIWIIVFLVLLIQPVHANVNFSVLLATVTILGLLFVYYTTYKVLTPKLLIKGKKFVYIILSILMIVVLAYVCARLDVYLYRYFELERKYGLRFVFSVSRFLVFLILTYAIANIIFFSKKTAEDAKQKERLMSEKKMLEIRILKSQINSHFMFNALNNIYSMTYFKDEYTSGYVLKLAQMMRYVMEDCETELTPLSKEMEYIENFIDFQKLRFEDDKNITFTYTLGNPNTLVPPMIFQPFVENCFKHTPLEVDSNSYIKIFLEASDKQIYFVSENSQPLIKNHPAQMSTGIGIENVKRRLELYYDGKHILKIINNPDFFKIELTIDL